MSTTRKNTRRRRVAVARAGLCAAVMVTLWGSAAHAQKMDKMDKINMKVMVPEPLGISMNRAGSGTTWIPDAVSLPSRHLFAGGWDVMLHGFAFGQYDKQGGDRGGSQVGSLNWMMLMASHELFGGRVQPRTMLSLDPWTVTPRGYPLLLQSGESYHGEPLHDRQHPHDFWMELGATYERAMSKDLGLALYAAPSGEPALGPVAFMHRPSAMDIPTAPLSHHWQDATHVSFGVLTAGVFTHTWKLEGSVFNGREPDENRWNFDPIKLDSYSGRITANPTANWSLSAAYGYLKSPEAHDPTQSLHRVTASVMHGTPLGANGEWATTFVYGGNKMSSHADLSNSVLLESEAVLDLKNTLFTRLEWVQKSAENLVLDVPSFNLPSDQHFNVGAASVGYIREIAGFSGATIGLGVAGTLNAVPSALEPAYGSRTPLGGQVFLRLRPTLKRAAMNDMGAMHMNHSMSAAPVSDSAIVVATVASFHAALAAGDSSAALGLLTDDALIVESGSVETRAEYRAHHLPADIEFVRAVPSTRTVVRVTVQGRAAWVVSTSTTQGQMDGRAVNSAGAELIVLRRTGAAWQIAAVHWSSRARRPASVR